MGFSSRDLLTDLQECRGLLQRVLAPEELENLLCELLVQKAWRDKGYGKRLHQPLEQGEQRSRVLSLLERYSLKDVPVDQIIALYARFRHPLERRRLGAYYSPPEVVDFILEHTLRHCLEQSPPERVTFLDPACGCGHFLIRAYDLFWAAYREQGVPSGEIPPLILSQNLYGVDLDPWALQLAALLLWEKNRELVGQRRLPSLNLVRADALRKEPEGSAARLLCRTFSVVGGNPPHVTNYARSSQRLDQAYIDSLKSQYQFSRGRTSNRYNLTMFFLERFLDLVEPGGRVGIVVDGSGLHTTVYREIREHIQERALIHQLVEDLEVFPGVNNRQAILILERAREPGRIRGHRVLWRRGLKGEVLEVEQASWSGTWLRPAPADVASLLAKIAAAGRPLSELYRPISGMNVTNRPESGLKPFLAQEPLDETYHKAIFSGNISPYILRWPTPEQAKGLGRKRMYICYDRELARAVNRYLEVQGEKARVSIGRSEERFRRPKLFVRQSLAGDRALAAAYSDDPEEYCDNSVYVINQCWPEFSLFYLLALLNSSLLTFYAREAGILSVASSGSATRLPMGNRRGKGLRDLPIPVVAPARQEPLVNLARQLVDMGRELVVAEGRGDRAAAASLQVRLAALREEVDGEVFRLYRLTENEVRVIRRR